MTALLLGLVLGFGGGYLVAYWRIHRRWPWQKGEV